MPLCSPLQGTISAHHDAHHNKAEPTSLASQSDWSEPNLANAAMIKELHFFK